MQTLLNASRPSILTISHFGPIVFDFQLLCFPEICLSSVIAITFRSSPSLPTTHIYHHTAQ